MKKQLLLVNLLLLLSPFCFSGILKMGVDKSADFDINISLQRGLHDLSVGTGTPGGQAVNWLSAVHDIICVSIENSPKDIVNYYFEVISNKDMEKAVMWNGTKAAPNFEGGEDVLQYNDKEISPYGCGLGHIQSQTTAP